MKVTIVPHGSAIQRRFDELTKAGKTEDEARIGSAPFDVDWPPYVPLPSPGDSVSAFWAIGKVAYVGFDLSRSGMAIRIKLE